MIMILQLLVAAVVVGLSVAAAPPYKEKVQAMIAANKTLEKNVLSQMDSPLLNDSRRHYAEIVHVVHYHGQRRSEYLNGSYYDEYYPYLDISAPEAISNPKLVVTKIINLNYKVHNAITELKDVINACYLETEVCNELIDDFVLMNLGDFEYPANVLLAAGDVATNLNDLNEQFEEVSMNLKAHHYVCTSPEDLEHYVESVAKLYLALDSYPI